MNFLLVLPAFISFAEISVILLIAVVIFGPKKIPEIARGLGEGIRAMKKATDEIKQEIMNPVESIQEEISKPLNDFNPIQSIQKEIDSTKDSLLEDVPNPIKEVEESIDDIVGPVKRK
ncbi:MAG: twin-arginine translocase TatA/TatE family subunit [Weeksellaceae bacterium]